MTKMGRPTDDPRSHSTMVRMTDSEYETLRYCAKELGVSQADVLRMGLKYIHKGLMNENSGDAQP